MQLLSDDKSHGFGNCLLWAARVDFLRCAVVICCNDLLSNLNPGRTKYHQSWPQSWKIILESWYLHSISMMEIKIHSQSLIRVVRRECKSRKKKNRQGERGRKKKEEGRRKKKKNVYRMMYRNEFGQNCARQSDPQSWVTFSPTFGSAHVGHLCGSLVGHLASSLRGSFVLRYIQLSQHTYPTLR